MQIKKQNINKNLFTIAILALVLNINAQLCLTPSSGSPFQVGTSPFSVISTDFNADGKPDLAFANRVSNNVSVLLGFGGGSFGLPVYFAVGIQPYSITSADFNNDGNVDLVTANNSSDSVSVLLGNGAGSFTSTVNYAVGISPFSVVSADFNTDGKADLAVANSGSNTISILLGNGFGSFAPAVSFAAGNVPISVTTADFNADGKADLAVANNGSNNVSLLLGNGAGSFAAPVNFAVGTGPFFVSSADFNADGKADLVVANKNSNNVSVLIGNGAGSFSAAVNFGVGTGPISVTSTDFNADGKVDLAVANLTGNNVSVLLGNGVGGFALPLTFTAGTSPRSVTNSDFNADGKADLAVANVNSNNVSVLLNVTPFVSANASSTVVCDGTNVTLTGGGATTYTWTGGVTNGVAFIPPVGNTTYTVTGINAVGCTNTQTITLTVNSQPTVSVNSANICNGQSATLIASGASTYLWNTGATTSSIIVSPASNSIYTVTGTTNGCINTQTASVTVNPNSTTTITSSFINPNCSGVCNGSATISASGAFPFTYSWTPAVSSSTSSIATGLCAGTYSCVVTNGCGFSDSTIINIVPPPPIVISISASSPSICAGSTTTLTGIASGAATPYALSWNTGATTSNVTVTPTTSPMTGYTLSVSDAQGCNATKGFSVTVYPKPNITASNSPFSPICAGKTATINLTGALNYTTNPGNITVPTFTVNPTNTTVYTIDGKSPQGCMGSAKDTIKVNAAPTISSNVNTNTLCAGSMLTFTNGGASTYTLNPSALTGSVITTFPTLAGTTIYTISGTNSFGCINSKTISIIVSNLPNVGISPTNTTICSGQSIVLTAFGANTYSWSTGSTSNNIAVSPGANTSYSVTGKNTNGCQSSTSSSINVIPTPIVSISSPSTNVCFGYTMTLTATGATNYQWFNATSANTTTVQPLANATYSVIGTNGGGCSDTAFLTITILPLPSVLATANNTLVCVGHTVGLTASGTANTYTWMPGFLQGPNQIVQIFTPTTFTLYGKGSNGCVFYSTALVNVYSSATMIPVSTPSAICRGDSSVLSVIGGGVPSWSNNSVPNTDIVKPIINTTYTINAVDFNGCSADIIFYVGINTDCDVITYNGFTPNGDGMNDFWIIDNIEKYPNNKVYIYNRWGNKVFQTTHYNNISNNWDGKLNGKAVTAGTYFYIIETDNEKLFKKGWIEITN